MYLEADPGWTERFSEVWQWTAWPGRAGVTDVGIDLVAASRGQSGFTVCSPTTRCWSSPSSTAVRRRELPAGHASSRVRSESTSPPDCSVAGTDWSGTSAAEHGGAGGPWPGRPALRLRVRFPQGAL
ncbi:hypothetical protein [Protofrankia sp. BMG5.30]|uniref:restriction endonuclease n=1 Tax=Protofrankia sp. BMG5.30 TaxID=1834514 RepID=UPI00352A71E9